MPAIHDVLQDQEIQQRLHQFFDTAAAKSLVVIDQTDAEPEMARFLREVKAHPEQRAFVVQLFIDSFAESFYMKWEPWELMQYCMHDLRWSEIRDFIKAKQEADLQQRGARASTIWRSILEAFDDHWLNAPFFQAFKKSAS